MRRMTRPAYKTTAAILWALFISFRSPTAQSPTQPPSPEPPRVISAAVPFYPHMARLAKIENVIVLRIATDGKSVAGVHVTSGYPGSILASAAEANVKTWQFVEHVPMTFETTFRYKLLPGYQDINRLDSGVITLHLPTEVEVSAVPINARDIDREAPITPGPAQGNK